MKNHCWLRILTLFIGLVYNGSFILGQVNTEIYRRTLENGLYLTLNSSLSCKSGNTDEIELSAGARLDYIRKPWYSFMVTNVKYTDTNDEVSTNKGFGHLRLGREFSQSLALEAFCQVEYNEFISLERRFLAGLAPRLTLYTIDKGEQAWLKLYLSLGAMWEYERLDNNELDPEDDHPVTSRLLRSTNYFSIVWKRSKTFAGSWIIYFQPTFKDFSDYRILFECDFNIHITEKLAFFLAWNYNYDSDPPDHIRHYDSELSNGIRLKL